MKNKKYKDKSQKLFDRIATIYEKVGSEDWEDQKNPLRELIWSKVGQGKVLEVGVGTGNNIRYYPPDIKVTAIDYSQNMMEYAKEKAQNQNTPIDFHLMDVQSLEFLDNTFDQAVVTYVFCSVPNPIEGLKELSRVVKPNGDIFLLEHGRINLPIIGILMDLLNPLIAHLSGENINRQIDQVAAQVGFQIIEIISYKAGLIKIVHLKNLL